MDGLLLPIIVFIAVYVLISFELLNKAVAAVLGVMLLVTVRTTEVRTAIGYIDFETIMLLMGMMAIVAVLRKSGFFAILSVKIAKLTGGNPLSILVLFSLVTAVISAFLDNVTTVLIMVPMVIEITRGMGLDPKIYIITQAMVSNIGGTATLIGDPPNVIIGSKVGLTFNQFAVYLALPVIFSFIGVLFYCWATQRERFQTIDTKLAKLFSVQLLLEKIEYDFLNIAIDRKFLIKSLGGLAAALLLFVTQTLTGITPGVAALGIAMILLVITAVDVEEMLREVDWSTLLFFCGLFILVGILEEKGVIEWIARNIFLRIGHNPYAMVLTVLWVSGMVSGFIDNIPFTIAMIPIVRLMLESQAVPHDLLWWALSLGACLGGNLTIVGASANIVSCGIAKKYGYAITFFEFMRTSAIATIISLVLSSLVLMAYMLLLK
jgi:Na+/H+ antiporter NhaD/arsenite permease-like protein